MTDKKKKRVLVAGAAGFIGSFLCPRFIREGYVVTALDIDEYVISNEYLGEGDMTWN